MSNAQLNSTLKSWDIIASRVYSATNTNLTLEAPGTANLFVKTNGNTIVTADSTGNATFTNSPICSVYPPTIPSQLVNKQYADSLFGPQGASGAQGAQGASGTSGSQGAQGAQGAGGSGGTQGAQGAQGAQGSGGGQGAQGAQGAAGSSGGQGAQGSAGGQGAQGSVGGPNTFTTNYRNNITFSSNTTSTNINLLSPLLLNSVSIGSVYISDYAEIKLSSGRLRFPDAAHSFYYDTAGSTFRMTYDLKVPLVAGSGGYAAFGTIATQGTSGGVPLYNNPSSLRYKTNVEKIQDSDEILKVNPVSYNFKDKDGNPKPEKQIGFIAEEMAEDELGNYFVVRNSDGSCETINYGLLIPLYASALRTLKTKFNDLTDEFEKLKENNKIQMSAYLKRINQLKNT